MHNVLFINPPQKHFETSMDFNVYFPIGLLSIAGTIKDICHLEILDCLVTEYEQKKEGRFIIHGMPFEKIKSKIKEFSPKIIGITVPFPHKRKWL